MDSGRGHTVGTVILTGQVAGDARGPERLRSGESGLAASGSRGGRWDPRKAAQGPTSATCATKRTLRRRRPARERQHAAAVTRACGERCTRELECRAAPFCESLARATPTTTPRRRPRAPTSPPPPPPRPPPTTPSAYSRPASTTRRVQFSRCGQSCRPCNRRRRSRRHPPALQPQRVRPQARPRSRRNRDARFAVALSCERGERRPPDILHRQRPFTDWAARCARRPADRGAQRAGVGAAGQRAAREAARGVQRRGARTHRGGRGRHARHLAARASPPPRPPPPPPPPPPPSLARRLLRAGGGLLRWLVRPLVSLLRAARLTAPTRAAAAAVRGRRAAAAAFADHLARRAARRTSSTKRSSRASASPRCSPSSASAASRRRRGACSRGARPARARDVCVHRDAAPASPGQIFNSDVQRVESHGVLDAAADHAPQRSSRVRSPARRQRRGGRRRALPLLWQLEPGGHSFPGGFPERGPIDHPQRACCCGRWSGGRSSRRRWLSSAPT